MPIIARASGAESASRLQSAAGLLDEARSVAAAIRKRWLWVAIAVATALAAALLFLMAVTPRYVATAQILIDPRAKRIVEGAVVPGGFGSSASGADTLLVDSQVELMQSSTVLRKFVEDNKLQQDPEFAVPRSSGGLRMLLRNTFGHALFGNDRETAPVTDPVDTAVWRFSDKHLRIRRVGNTYVINVAVMSQDAAKAAKLANAVANAYISDQVRATGDTTREATNALQSRIVDLRKKVEQAENAVEAFRSKAGLIGGPNLLVNEQQLQQTNDKLIVARSQVTLAKARYDQVKDLSARAGAALLGAQSDALKSPVIANLRASLSRVERREAIAQQTLRPGHPEYGAVLVEKRALLTQIDEELARIKANAKSELDLAQSSERSLTAELKALEQQTVTNNQSQVRLRELQREAQSARTIFEQFLNRAKETSEQELLARENTRIISEASIPPYPTFPPTFLLLIGSVLFGLLTGIGAAWLAYVLGNSATPATAAPRAVRPRPTTPAGAVTPSRVVAPASPPAAADAGLRPRLRKMLAPLAKPKSENRSPTTAPFAATASQPPVAPTAQTKAPLVAAAVPNGRGRSGLETIARLPSIAAPSAGERKSAGQLPPSFSDHIAAVDDVSARAYPGYREVIDNLLSGLRGAPASSGRPSVCLMVGAEAGAGTSSTALALAYRAAIKGRRTLLIDACAADPRLSQVFAGSLRQTRPCVLDSEAHLAEITLTDSRTGLSMLPIALANLLQLDADQQRRLLAGLRQLTRRFDLVVIDAGAASENQAVAFLTAIADTVLIMTPQGTSAALARLRAIEAARRFPAREAPAAIVETAAA